MSILFDQTVFGPVKSRRLGISLGINLLPNNRKLCTYDCIYCECGWNTAGKAIKPILPTLEDVREQLTHKLEQMSQTNELPDVITFAGNGEPTIHPQFVDIIDLTIELRNRYAPKAQIAVLSNATTLFNKPIVEALKKIDEPILKLDGGFESTIMAINQPVGAYQLERAMELLIDFGEKAIIQTLFVEGTVNGKTIDNTSDEEIEAWIELIGKIKPQKVMIYTIDRDTPASGLRKVSKDRLDQIAKRLKNKVDTKIDVAG